MQDLDIFNVNMDDFSTPSTASKNSADQFKPDPKLSRDGVYSAIVRPIYWLGNNNGFNPKKNYIEKKTFYLKNEAEDGGYFDSPYSIGEKCQAMNAFFKLKKEGKTNERSDELANKIKPKSSFFYLVYVEKDITTPENEGKVMVWKAPIQIHNLINTKVNPDEKALKLGKKPEDIFSPMDGRSIEVNVSVKNKFWTYENCELEASRAMTFKGSEFSADNKQELIDEITKGNEMMEPYIYKAMEADRTELLLDIITEKTGMTFGKTSVQKRGMDIAGVEDTSTQSGTSEVDDVLNDINTDAPAVTSKDEPADGTTEINSFIDDLDLDL